MRQSIPKSDDIKNIEKLVKDFADKYPVEILKEENSNVDVKNEWYDLLYDYAYSNDLNILLKSPGSFFEGIVTYWECGATIKIEKYEGKINELTKLKVYEIMWPENSIAERYSDDFIFDMKDFGYQIFSFNNKIYLCSGIPG
jgi:hypothetical protein